MTFLNSKKVHWFCSTGVLEPGYEGISAGVEVLVLGYEGISAGVEVLVLGYEGISSGV